MPILEREKIGGGVSNDLLLIISEISYKAQKKS